MTGKWNSTNAVYFEFSTLSWWNRVCSFTNYVINSTMGIRDNFPWTQINSFRWEMCDQFSILMSSPCRLDWHANACTGKLVSVYLLKLSSRTHMFSCAVRFAISKKSHQDTNIAYTQLTGEFASLIYVLRSRSQHLWNYGCDKTVQPIKRWH